MLQKWGFGSLELTRKAALQMIAGFLEVTTKNRQKTKTPCLPNNKTFLFQG